MSVIFGGRTNYGETIGILMLDTRFPRIPGDVGNATTFNFPVRYKLVKGASIERVIEEGDEALLLPFIKEAKDLEAEGVRAITTSCGFLALFQKEIAAQLSIPFFSSSLIQAKIASQIIAPNKKVGIITAEAKSLNEKHFKAVGIQDVPKIVLGMDDTEEFFETFLKGKETLDVEKTRYEMIKAGNQIRAEHPDIGALVLECTNMCPFSKAIQDTTGLPVFDITTLINFVHNAVNRNEFRGIM